MSEKKPAARKPAAKASTEKKPRTRKTPVRKKKTEEKASMKEWNETSLFGNSHKVVYFSELPPKTKKELMAESAKIIEDYCKDDKNLGMPSTVIKVRFSDYDRLFDILDPNVNDGPGYDFVYAYYYDGCVYPFRGYPYKGNDEPFSPKDDPYTANTALEPGIYYDKKLLTYFLVRSFVEMPGHDEYALANGKLYAAKKYPGEQRLVYLNELPNIEIPNHIREKYFPVFAEDDPFYGSMTVCRFEDEDRMLEILSPRISNFNVHRMYYYGGCCYPYHGHLKPSDLKYKATILRPGIYDDPDELRYYIYLTFPHDPYYNKYAISHQVVSIQKVTPSDTMITPIEGDEKMDNPEIKKNADTEAANQLIDELLQGMQIPPEEPQEEKKAPSLEELAATYCDPNHTVADIAAKAVELADNPQVHITEEGIQKGTTLQKLADAAGSGKTLEEIAKDVATEAGLKFSNQNQVSEKHFDITIKPGEEDKAPDIEDMDLYEDYDADVDDDEEPSSIEWEPFVTRGGTISAKDAQGHDVDLVYDHRNDDPLSPFGMLTTIRKEEAPASMANLKPWWASYDTTITKSIAYGKVRGVSYGVAVLPLENEIYPVTADAVRLICQDLVSGFGWYEVFGIIFRSNTLRQSMNTDAIYHAAFVMFPSEAPTYQKYRSKNGGKLKVSMGSLKEKAKWIMDKIISEQDAEIQEAFTSRQSSFTSDHAEFNNAFDRFREKRGYRGQYYDEDDLRGMDDVDYDFF